MCDHDQSSNGGERVNMTKKRGVLFFVIAIVVILLFCFTAVVGWGPTNTGSAGNITLGLDLRGGTSVTYEIQDEEFTQTDIDDTIYKLQLRVAEYSADATVYQEGEDRITVEIPGVYDEQAVIEALGKPGSLQFVTYDEKNDDDTVDYSQPTVWVTGSDISSAEAGTQQDDTTGASEYVVQLGFNEAGTEAFGEATSSHVGEIIYVIYDDEVVSAPTVQSAITNGNAVIEGMDSFEEAQTLASTIRIGSLNLTLKDISSKVVGAKLGDNAVSTSLIAGAIGLILIIIFLCIFYRIPGVAASIALIFYVGAILLLLNAFDVTLTVSGIAGIILSIGMAVDGNVIINARIKEELQSGRSVSEAIKQGFKKSTSAILDGNITTLIVALVLMIFGSGTVNGFGLTLAIGIVMSVITSLLVTRLFVQCFYAMGAKKESSYAKVTKGKKAKSFDFVGKKIIFFIIAGVLIIAGVATMIINNGTDAKAFNYSIEFVGGVSTEVEFTEDISIDDFNDNIKPAISELIGSTDVEGQKTTGSNYYVIKTPELDVDMRDALKDLLINDYGAVEDTFTFTSISSVISNELTRDAFVSLAVAIICMLIYIWIRFRKFKFSIASVIALVHDVLIVVGFYAVFRLSVGNSFIACVLTIVGYSINATIVIFDRIRENMRDPALNYDLKKVVNTSIQQTLTRSIFTSATTFIMVLFLFILGVESMKAFALPIAVGIVAGTFSSVFISGPLFYVMNKKADRYDPVKAARAARSLGAELEPQSSIAEKAGNKAADNLDDASGTTDAQQTDIAGGAAPGIVIPGKITANPNRKKKKKRKQ